MKFESFQRGDRIRAYDFEPMPGRENRYVEGVITARNPGWGTLDYPYGHYVVTVSKDTLFPEKMRTMVVVPMEMNLDWDNRISKI